VSGFLLRLTGNELTLRARSFRIKNNQNALGIRSAFVHPLTCREGANEATAPGIQKVQLQRMLLLDAFSYCKEKLSYCSFTYSNASNSHIVLYQGPTLRVCGAPPIKLIAT